MKIHLSFLCALVVIMLSCNSSTFEEDPMMETFRSYVQLEEGRHIDYQYDTVIIRNNSRDTISGYLRHRVGAPYVLNSGDTAHTIEIFWKRNLSDPFKRVGSESARMESDRFVVSDDGLNFIKLVFPLSEGTTWKGNSLFNTDEDINHVIEGIIVPVIPANSDWTYKVEDLNTMVVKEDRTYDQVLHINHVDDLEVNFVFDRAINEYYMKDVGMVYRQVIIQNLQSDMSGFTLDLYMIDHN